MKKTIILSAVCAILFASCTKVDYDAFVGTWGVEKIEYYNIDYAGNPISASLKAYNYDPNSFDNGMHLVFNGDKTGYMRDSAIDTIYDNYNEATQQYETVIYCPDTVLIYPFTCSYDQSDKVLYMNMDYGTSIRTFKMAISGMGKNSFVYENEYRLDCVEKAHMKRVEDIKSTPAVRGEKKRHPYYKSGSLMGNR